MRLTLVLALAALVAGCSSGSNERRVDVERAFLAGIEGEWTGIIAETPALQKKVMRETPMRLVVPTTESQAPSVEYPLVECEGMLSAAPGAAEFTATTGRFQLRIVSGKLGGVCQPGLVRVTKRGDTLEYSYLGDTLRKVAATLTKTP